ncbi:hypothetical protein PIROE2DRAFT_8086 [Piromyces sp. E2]|nr:hypothetical protein PIROE2DRAFT_8086 [Piromyces sp. E2]|eukprot:OUM65023.1 hypothetical protein PIROE2DRAFT_8086 [Piromyces sp. E2]
MATEYKYPGLHQEKSAPTKLEITVSCKNLPKMDNLSESDPKVFLFLEKKEFNNVNVNSIWSRIDSTETINNNPNPVFQKSFFIDYYFETIQKLRFMVVDMDDKSEEWIKNDFIGYVEVSIADLIHKSKDNVFTADLLTNVPDGMEVNNVKARAVLDTSKIFIRVEEVEKVTHTLNIDITGTNLDKKKRYTYIK